MALVIYMPDVPFSSAHQSPVEMAYLPAQNEDTRQSFWDCLPADTLALVASHLKPRHIAAARETCKAWRYGISRGVTTLAPNVQSPAGNRVGSVASFYLYAALRWQDMPQLLVNISFCMQISALDALLRAFPAPLLSCSQHLLACTIMRTFCRGH